ncbi:hypothetical protein [Deinococcus cellulosilyticus]|uniref:Lipoprotein n=1 Tax=Deinococcus cellulosilyticus (strain DSM 18568 / NBRC 106333 / KACC 11606 / 5516J-15) TaxID=1223518 RepID=A0A511NB84_DEIC1|nr:hypothetical protein [Deinococcus cellulosilyticus]GEM50062.1 hypothetical protein DC3_56970 [Deinococcus cellulosilyticus NBRC 106333 = KACC 11606]
MKSVVLWLVLLLMVACAPRAQNAGALEPTVKEVQPLTLEALPEAATTELLQAAQAVLQGLQITVRQVTGKQYRGQDSEAFVRMVDRFYAEHPGYCPLEEAFYFTNLPSVYLTVTAKGNQVAVFIYDQRNRPQIQAVVAEGTMPNAPVVTVCAS